MDRALLFEQAVISLGLKLESYQYNENHETYCDLNGEHFGKGFFLELVKEPCKIKVLINKCCEEIANAESEQSLLYERAADKSLTYVEVHAQWNALLKSYYRGALDLITPFEFATDLIKSLADLHCSSTICSELMLGVDGKNVRWYREHALTLYFAYLFRKADWPRQVGTYDSYSRTWLELNFVPLGRKEAFDVSAEGIDSAIRQYAKDNKLDKLLTNLNRDNLNLGFEIIREKLIELQRIRRETISRFEFAKNEAISAARDQHKPLIENLCDLIGNAITLNEIIHHKICLAANILRCAAIIRKLGYVYV